VANQRLTVITGAARGIGETIARRFSAGGDKIIIGDVLDDAGLETVAALEAEGGKAAYYSLDVTSEGSVSGFVNQVEKDHGPIDVFINNAGIMQDEFTIEEFPMEDHDRVWDVDYRGVYMCCRSVVPRMKKRKQGVIGNVASMFGIRPYPVGAYSPAKTAVIALTEILAAECGPYNVRVNSVSPGYVHTPKMQERFDQGIRNREVMVRDSALGCMTEMQDIAEAFWFLCSDRAKAITGTNLPVDAGVLVATSYNAYPR
jgi:NAD(P)-dependent dehydrogenase (short-subunit alcohol dehydrogenase family)